jgi:hypothetical protein
MLDDWLPMNQVQLFFVIVRPVMATKMADFLPKELRLRRKRSEVDYLKLQIVINKYSSLVLLRGNKVVLTNTLFITIDVPTAVLPNTTRVSKRLMGMR